MAGDPDPMVRFQVALTLGATSGDRRALEVLGSLAVRDAGDSWTRTAVLSSVGKNAPQLVDILAGKDGFFDTSAGRIWLDELAALIAAGRDPAQIRGLVAPLVAARRDTDLVIRVLVAVNRGARRSGTSVSELLQADRAEADRSARRAGHGNCPLRCVSPSAGFPLSPCWESPAVQRALEVLGELLDARQPASIQLAALQALGQVNDPAVGRLVIAHWKALSPGIRREAAELLFSRRDRLEHLLEALESRTIVAAEIDPDRLKQLRSHKDAQLRARAIRIIDHAALPARIARRRSRRSRVSQAPGPAGEGACRVSQGVCHLPSRPRRGCGGCPRPGDRRRHDPADDLLLHILDPNREVAPNYVNYNVATTDGRTISGIIASESATAVTLKRAQGATDVVPRDQIEAVASTGLSLMPEGLEKGQTPQDLADLIAFLRANPGNSDSPPSPAGR